MTTLYLCGAGNSVGVQLALAINRQQARWGRILLLDDDPAKHGQSILGVKIAGPFAMLEQADADTAEVSNLVTRSTAKRWAARCKIEEYGLPFATLIHPSVDVAGVEFGQDFTAYQNSTVGPRASMGEGSVVWMGATVGQECRLGRCCIVGPHAVVNGRVQLGDSVYIGTNASILPELKVGPWATIGAGSAAFQNVPAGATVLGVPGKIVWRLSQKMLDQKLKVPGSGLLARVQPRELESQVR